MLKRSASGTQKKTQRKGGGNRVQFDAFPTNNIDGSSSRHPHKDRGANSLPASKSGKPLLVSVVCLAVALQIWIFVRFYQGIQQKQQLQQILPQQQSAESGNLFLKRTGVENYGISMQQNATSEEGSFQTIEEALKDPISGLPLWIRNYVRWHQEQRAKYPGMKLWTDPGAPKLLIRTCLGLCGGLHDRLGQLPWDLYLANRTGRLLLMHWHRPVALEHFLQPNVLDWRVPPEVPGMFPKQGVRTVPRDEMKIARAGLTNLFEGYEDNRPTQKFWDRDLDTSLLRAVQGKFKDVKVLRHRLLGHLDEAVLEKRLQALGETDMIHWTPSFGKIFWMFFKAAPGVQTELEKVYQEMPLTPGLYSAVHCRVRHPKATPKNVHVLGKNTDYTADKSGLPWEGDTRNFAIETATYALQCAETLHSKWTWTKIPMYFMADSSDLVHYISHQLKDPAFVAGNRSLFARSTVDKAALQVVESAPIVARDVSRENAHIDRQKGREAPAYYATFVDLFLAVNARCVTYGIGFYGLFATKISGTTCKMLYQEEHWGGSANKRQSANVCALPMPPLMAGLNGG